MGGTFSIVDLIQNVVVPILALVGGWFAHLFRSKQKKESDILDNVQQILNMQSEYIKQQDAENKRTRDMNARLEKKLNEKRRSIRQANWCKFTAEGDGCPVLNHEQKTDVDQCETCKYNKEEFVEGEYDKS